MPRCLVLGGTGFIGSRVVSQLLGDGWDVTVLVRSPITGAISDKLVRIVEGDFADSIVLTNALEGCSACVHSITATSPKSANENPVFDVEANLLPALSLLKLLARHGIERTVFLSSGGTVYGSPRYTPIDEKHPTDPLISYAITKVAIEQYFSMYAREMGMDYRILRVANPFGAGQRLGSNVGVVTTFMANVLQHHPITIWGDGSVVRDYLYVDNVADAVRDALSYNGSDTIFNIGSGIGRSLIEVIDSIEQISGLKAEVRLEPSRSIDVQTSVLDITKARAELGWQPRISFEQGLRNMHDRFRAQ